MAQTVKVLHSNFGAGILGKTKAPTYEYEGLLKAFTVATVLSFLTLAGFLR
jgi:hypothetical protein